MMIVGNEMARIEAIVAARKRSSADVTAGRAA
jgi:hypothetical protein